MDSSQFADFIATNRPRIESALTSHMPFSTASGTTQLNDALRCAVFPGGKRLRPHLAMIASELGGASDEQSLLIACAVEFIHTSSLIFDDLPAMDDAELRRNLPALHITFGEGTAILAAVALLNQAYALFAKSAQCEKQTDMLPLLIEEVCRCIGNSGMIAGQAAELSLSGTSADEFVLSSRELKTTGLMRLMMVAGAIVSRAPDAEVKALSVFGECFGRAYQIHDDLSDVVEDRLAVRKTVGQDSRHLRPTEVAGLSREEVCAHAREVLQSGKSALEHFGDRPQANLLRSAADYIVARFSPVAA